MQVLEVAKNMEQQGLEYYKTLANECPLAELKGIFEFLAKEEKRHFDMFDAAAKGVKAPNVDNEHVLDNAKKVFAKWAEGFSLPETVYDYEKAYSKALDLEKKSIEYYKDLRSKANDPSQQAMLDFIIEQENHHARLMDNLVNFVRRPKEWLDSSEWNHLDAY